MAVEDGAQQGALELATHSAGGLLPGLWKFQLLLQFWRPRRGRLLLRQRLGGDLNVSCQVAAASHQVNRNVLIDLLTDTIAVITAGRAKYPATFTNTWFDRLPFRLLAVYIKKWANGRDLIGMQEVRKMPHATQINDNERQIFCIFTFI